MHPERAPGRARSLTLVAGLLSLTLLAGCHDEITNINPPADTQNAPPQITLFGPTYADGEVLVNTTPQFRVLVTDADGAADIAAVVLDVASVRVESMIVRPDNAAASCREIYYAPFQTIDLLDDVTPRAIRVEARPLLRDGGLYGTYLGYWELTDGGLSHRVVAAGTTVKECYSGQDYPYYLESFGLYPPRLPVARDVYVTRVEFLLSGVTVTAYDEAGQSAVAHYPDIRVRFTNSREEQTAP